MYQKFKRIGGQFLIVLNVFVLFLLLFTKDIVLPFWLQPIGRMHPLILHFPIVVLILALALDGYRFTNHSSDNPALINNAQILLLLGALLAGITVVMGLFLSRENGYAGDVLVWHKWTGSAIFFLSSLMYGLQNTRWYKRTLAWVSGGVLMLVIVVTGHYGGVLSHGENFIVQPILSHAKKPLVPIDKAVVFTDLIQPILDKNCIGCHNLHKQKGELSLADTLSILKGGKTGKLLVPGYPEISLLLQRIHLPADDEKHMPPSGKPQLTTDEINMLQWWIKNQSGFTEKVMALPVDDSLRLLAAKLLKGSDVVEETYDFPAADEKLIAKLISNYRSIQHVAKESPAVDVRMFNKESYSVKQLEELSTIKKQIISLSLAKLPVTDNDLKTISGLENLRKLDVNFTNITSVGLASLSSLQHLQTLSLSGTKLKLSELKEFVAQHKQLKSVAVWNAGLSANEIAQLQQAFKNIHFIEGFSIDETAQLKLNPPQVKNNSLVFANSIAVALYHPINGVEIRYTTNGKEPDSITSPVFDHTTVLTQTTTILAKAYKKGWYASDVISFSFFKNSFIPDSVAILTKLNSVHQAEGTQTFFNTRLGVIGANNPAWANFWAGVRDNDLMAVCVFNKPVTIASYGLHYMVEEATGIYPPGSVEIWGGNNAQKLTLLTTITPPLPVKGDKPSLKLAEASFKPRTISYLKIIAKPYVKNKDRHLLLVDEMFLN